jgi:Yip1-like protein
MNYPSNPSLIADLDQPTTQGALPVWTKVYTKPNEQTFVEITSHPEAKAKAAYIWVFLAGTLSGFISGFTQLFVMRAGLQQAVPNFGQMPGVSEAFGIGGLVGVVCGAPLAGLFSVIGFAIGVAIIHATARFFGGQGTFDKLAYAFGAIVVPFSLISALMGLLNAIPFVVFGALPVLVLLGLYVLFLQMTAIKAVHQCGWGEAAAILFLPAILIGMLCGVAFLLLMRSIGPSLNDLFQQMQRFQ